MKKNLLTQLNDIRFHLGQVFQSLKQAQSSLNEAKDIVEKVEPRPRPELKLVIDNANKN